MKIHYKKEVYLVSMDNVSYSRINGKWHVNTGGSPLDWREVENEQKSMLLETKFKEVI